MRNARHSAMRKDYLELVADLIDSSEGRPVRAGDLVLGWVSPSCFLTVYGLIFTLTYSIPPALQAWRDSLEGPIVKALVRSAYSQSPARPGSTSPNI